MRPAPGALFYSTKVISQNVAYNKGKRRKHNKAKANPKYSLGF
jgi:hypothetical protein